MAPAGDLARAHEHDHGAHDAHQHRRREAHQGRGGQTLENVIEQPLHAFAEDLFFARFGMVTLHDAHAAERFGETAGDFGVDFASLAENRPDSGEGFAQH